METLENLVNSINTINDNAIQEYLENIYNSESKLYKGHIDNFSYGFFKCIAQYIHFWLDDILEESNHFNNLQEKKESFDSRRKELINDGNFPIKPEVKNFQFNSIKDILINNTIYGYLEANYDYNDFILSNEIPKPESYEVFFAIQAISFYGGEKNYFYDALSHICNREINSSIWNKAFETGYLHDIEKYLPPPYWILFREILNSCKLESLKLIKEYFGATKSDKERWLNNELSKYGITFKILDKELPKFYKYI